MAEREREIEREWGEKDRDRDRKVGRGGRREKRKGVEGEGKEAGRNITEFDLKHKAKQAAGQKERNVGINVLGSVEQPFPFLSPTPTPPQQGSCLCPGLITLLPLVTYSILS